MRLDLFLKASRLVKSRSVAQDFCDAGLVKVNGASAKSSKEIKPGDRLTIRRRNKVTEYSVESVPSHKQVSKDQASTLYKTLSETELSDD
jgi:ribosome-associated heat shock protein Hsp15